jgi:hypothetical protein
MILMIHKAWWVQCSCSQLGGTCWECAQSLHPGHAAVEAAGCASDSAHADMTVAGAAGVTAQLNDSCHQPVVSHL